MKKYAKLIIICVGAALVGIFLLWNNYIDKEHRLELQLLGSDRIDTSDLREYMGIKKDEPLVYFLHLPSGSEAPAGRDILENSRLELPEHLLSSISNADTGRYVMLSIGRELAEVNYKFLRRYHDGSASEAMVTFDEEYQENMVYIYSTHKSLFLFGEYYYIVDGDNRIFLGDSLAELNRTE